MNGRANMGVSVHFELISLLIKINLSLFTILHFTGPPSFLNNVQSQKGLFENIKQLNMGVAFRSKKVKPMLIYFWLYSISWPQGANRCGCKKTLVLQKSVGKLPSALTPVNTFLMILWAQSFLLCHICVHFANFYHSKCQEARSSVTYALELTSC